MTNQVEKSITHPQWHFKVEFVHDAQVSTAYNDEGVGISKFQESINTAIRVVKVQESHLTGEKK